MWHPKGLAWPTAARCATFCCALTACDAPADQACEDEAAEGGPKADSIDGEPDDAASVRPPLVRFVDNSRFEVGVESSPRPLPTVLQADRATIDSALASFVDDIAFADYPFSGCHDRAHVTYAHLARTLGTERVAKVWVFSSRLMTVALPGQIESPVDEARWGAPTTTWDYHMAAVVRGPDGLLVVDPVLADPTSPLTLDEWFGHMTPSPGSVYTLADGELYSFNVADAGLFANGRTPFNGAMFEYSGFARSDRWLEKDLARDAVGVALSERVGECPELRVNLLEPQLLYDALEGMRFGNFVSNECAPYFDRYLAELAAWSNTVDALQ